MKKAQAMKQAYKEIEKNNAYAVCYKCNGEFTCMPYYSMQAFDMMYDDLDRDECYILFHDGMEIITGGGKQ